MEIWNGFRSWAFVLLVFSCAFSGAACALTFVERAYYTATIPYNCINWPIRGNGPQSASVTTVSLTNNSNTTLSLTVQMSDSGTGVHPVVTITIPPAPAGNKYNNPYNFTCNGIYQYPGPVVGSGIYIIQSTPTQPNVFWGPGIAYQQLVGFYETDAIYEDSNDNFSQGWGPYQTFFLNFVPPKVINEPEPCFVTHTCKASP